MNRELPTHKNHGPDDEGSDGISLSGVLKTESEIHDTFASIRYSLIQIDGRDTIHTLQVIARHPKLPQHERVFDISYLLPDASQKIPQTLERVIKPDLPLEDRLAALMSLVNHLEADRVVHPISEQGEITPLSDPIRDELEPKLSFHTCIYTSLSEALARTSVRGVSVLRNNDPFLEFRVVEERDGSSSAHLLVVPTGLELPLLDRKGHPVRADTADEALHDFTHLLYHQRSADAEHLLRAIGRNLSQRQRSIYQDLMQPGAIPFVGHMLRALNQMNALRDLENTLDIAPCLAPRESDYLPRNLPDGRVMWIAHETSGPSSHYVRFAGHSGVGEPYGVELRLSPHTFSKARRAFHQLLRDESTWPSFKQLADLVARDQHGKVSLNYSPESSSYPVLVNDLITSLEDLGTISCLRGAVPDQAYSTTAYIPHYIDEIIRGRTPLFMRIQGSHPATTWGIQAFFDEELRGHLFMRNSFCGNVVVSTADAVLGTAERMAEIERMLQSLVDNKPPIFQGDPLSSSFREQRFNLPNGSPVDRISYEAANHAAAVCVGAMQREGYSRKAPEVSWIVQRLEEGRWSVTLPSIFSVGGALPYLINMQVGIEGVWEVAYSRGTRGPLGALFGRRVFSGLSGPSLSDHELERIISLICSDASRQSPMQEFQELNKIRPGMMVLPLAPLRDLDPEALQRDTLARLWNGLKTLIRSP